MTFDTLISPIYSILIKKKNTLQFPFLALDSGASVSFEGSFVLTFLRLSEKVRKGKGLNIY